MDDKPEEPIEGPDMNMDMGAGAFTVIVAGTTLILVAFVFLYFAIKELL